MTNDIISKMLGLLDIHSISREAEHQLEAFRALIQMLTQVSGDDSAGGMSLRGLKDFERI